MKTIYQIFSAGNRTYLRAMLVFLLSVSLSSAAWASKTVTKNYTVKAFSELKVSSAFQVEFIYSTENKVSIEIDEDAADNVYVGNTGDELTIKLKDCNTCNVHTMKAKVYGSTLSGIRISGASGFTSDHTFSGKDIHIECSGASAIDIRLNTANAELKISGASKVTAEGNAGKQSIEISGASRYNGKNCKSADVEIESSGASKSIIRCSDNLEVEASGASSVVYMETPKNIRKSISGASSVELN